MSYKDLLVVLDSDAASRRRIDLAAALAERFAAHLVGLYPLPVAEMPHHLGYYDPRCSTRSLWICGEQAQAAADKEREAFEHTASLRGVSAEWRVVEEGPEADAALHARYADLTILGQLDPDHGEAGSDPAAPGAGDLRLGAPGPCRPLCRAIRDRRPPGTDRLER